MTGFERTMAALNGERTDRPPFDFWAEEPTLNRLFAYLGHHDLERFLDDMQIDIRAFNAGEPGNRQLGNGVHENMWGERFIYQETGWGGMREDIYGALYYAESMGELMAFPFPGNDVMDYSKLREQCLEAKEKKLAVRYGFADIWQRPGLVRGMENHLADMIMNPEWVHYLSRVFTDFYLEDYRRAWEVSGGNIDIFMVISDLGTQRGALISVQMFDAFIAPYLTEMAELIHGFGAKCIFHSCGNIASLIPSIIKCGVDILNPIQPAGTEMSPESLKNLKKSKKFSGKFSKSNDKFSKKICFHGGIDVQRLLPSGTPDEIKREAQRYAEVLGAGYILCPAHLFQPDTPPENIIALYKAFE
jgi:uroporphyrinogen decarboxylase